MLRAAASLAARFAADVRVIPAFFDPDLVFYGTVLNRAATAAEIERFECAERERDEMIASTAHAIATEFRLAISEEPIAGASISVEKRSLNPASAISSASVLSDILVFGAKAARGPGTQAEFFSDALLSDRAPILLARGAQSVLDAPIAIAWDASPQAGRAVRAALPLLAQAPAIKILQCPHGLTDAQKEAANPARLSDYLMRHGAVEPEFVAVEGPSEGEAILAAAHMQGNGVLIAGGYGRSRFHEWALGGATRTFVTAEEGPHLLLSH